MTYTTRRYSRSLSEAFPDVRAASIERPRPSFTRLTGIGHTVVLWYSLIGSVVLVLVLWVR